MDSSGWRVAKFGPGLERAVPEIRGVYSLVRARRSHSLLVGLQHLYIGQSKNLQRRWIQHADDREPNPGLNRIAHREDLEFWWRPVELRSVDAVENALIRELQPALNIKGRQQAHRPRDDCC